MYWINKTFLVGSSSSGVRTLDGGSVERRDRCLPEISLSHTVPVLRRLPLELRLVDLERNKEYSSPNSGDPPDFGERLKHDGDFSVRSNSRLNFAFLSILFERLLIILIG